MQLCDLAFNIPVRREFTYIVPDDWPGGVTPGDRVIAPLSGREAVGIVTRVHRTGDPIVGLKPLQRPAAGFRIPPNILELTRWTADYYLSSWGEALTAAAGPSLGTAKLTYRLKRLDWDTGKDKFQRLAAVDQDLLRILSARRHVTLDTILRSTERRRTAVLGTLRHLIEKGWIESEWRMTTPTEPVTADTSASGDLAVAPEPGVE